jgi:hypothetical protein
VTTRSLSAGRGLRDPRPNPCNHVRITLSVDYTFVTAVFRHEQSFWPQTLAEACRGPPWTTRLWLCLSIEMTWEVWRTLCPSAHVVVNIGSLGGNDRYAYGNYQQKEGFAFPRLYIDPRRPPEERVLGLRDGEGSGLRFRSARCKRVVRGVRSPCPAAPGRSPRCSSGTTAAAPRWQAPQIGDEALTFRAGEAAIEDVENGSRRSVGGRAVAGPLAGTRLDP